MSVPLRRSDLVVMTAPSHADRECVDCGVASGGFVWCEPCGRRVYLYEIRRCQHFWPTPVYDSSVCGGCGLTRGDFSG
jgi:hypothetical protein